MPLIPTSVSWQAWVMSFSDAEYQAMVEPSDHENMVFHRSLGYISEEAVIQGEEPLPTTSVKMGQIFPRQEKNTNRSTFFGVAGYIIVMEFCERLAYYGFAGLFCGKRHILVFARHRSNEFACEFSMMLSIIRAFPSD